MRGLIGWCRGKSVGDFCRFTTGSAVLAGSLTMTGFATAGSSRAGRPASFQVLT